ncbi:hypothetical protein AVEN_34605-1 [Araneus ventricosus]|uniref:Uncharacterized protein n=1 Tax=Araneus ventricosus TaxID=182803 RepID=A0A4Y2B2A6_ARAVE|nr:hypothetical protein AVEN_34605-1 [Araneus ventricosus]
MVKHLPAETLQQLLYAQRRMLVSVVVEQSLSDYYLFQNLKTFLAKQHFPSDYDVQTDGCHRLAPLSRGESLQHRCTEIGPCASTPVVLMLRGS